jgi:hypothetical protein
MTAIDTEGKFGKDYDAAWLQQSGINTVLRYISSGEQAKCIDADELQSFMENGITVGIIYELWGGSKGLPGSIDAANGTADGGYALRTLRALRVPENVVVYFAVDTSVDTNDDINTYVIPYFQAAKQAMGGYYRIGAYGCGSTCAAALSAANCDKALLANATSWDGYNTFLASGRAAIVQGLGPNLYDPDTIGDPDWGGFTALAALAEV